MPEVKGGRALNTFLGTHGSNYLKINGKNRHFWFVCRNNSRSKCQYLTYTLFSVSQRITKQGNVFCRPPRARIPGQRCVAAGQSCFCPHCSAKVASTLSFPSSPPKVSGPEAGMSVALWTWSRGPSLQSRSSSSCLGQWGLLSALWKVTHNGNNPCVLRFYYIKPNYIGFHRFCSNHGLNFFFPLALILCLLHARSCAICCTDA